MNLNMSLDQAAGLQDIINDYIDDNLADIIDQKKQDIINHLRMDGYTIIKPEVEEED